MKSVNIVEFKVEASHLYQVELPTEDLDMKVRFHLLLKPILPFYQLQLRLSQQRVRGAHRPCSPQISLADPTRMIEELR